MTVFLMHYLLLLKKDVLKKYHTMARSIRQICIKHFDILIMQEMSINCDSLSPVSITMNLGKNEAHKYYECQRWSKMCAFSFRDATIQICKKRALMIF